MCYFAIMSDDVYLRSQRNLKEVFHIGDDLSIDITYFFRFSVPVVDDDESLFGVDAGVAFAAAFPAGLFNELAGGEFHPSVSSGVGDKVRESI